MKTISEEDEEKHPDQSKQQEFLKIANKTTNKDHKPRPAAVIEKLQTEKEKHNVKTFSESVLSRYILRTP